MARQNASIEHLGILLIEGQLAFTQFRFASWNLDLWIGSAHN